MLSVRRTCPLKLLKLKRNLPFFQAHCHHRLLFWRKLPWKKFWMEGNRHQQSEPAGHRHGIKREDTDCMEKRRSTSPQDKDFTWRSRETEGQAASRRGSNRKHMSRTIRKRIFFLANRGSKQNKVSPWGYVVWVTDWEVRKLCGATGAKRQSWAERKCPSNAGLDS